MTSRGPRGATLATTCLLLVLAVVASLCAAFPAGAAPAPDLKALRADVERTADRLAAATVAWEKGQQTLGELVTRKMLSKRAAEQLEKDVLVAQQRVSNLAASMYRNPVDPMITAVLTGEPNAIADMRVLRATLGQSRTAQQDAIKLLSTHAARAQELVQTQDDAATLAIRLHAKLDDDLTKLQADASASLARLEAGAAEIRRRAAVAAAAAAAKRGQMNAERLARMAAAGALGGGDGTPCSGGIAADVINGFLPDSALCPLHNAPGHRLVSAAASAFNQMTAAYAETFGKPLCVTDSYRDYAGQVAVFRSKPNLAATPGRSNHGWGVAIDFCGGIQGFGSPAHEWMRANAGAFGWVHPGWAQQGGSKPEAWHWEFAG